MIKSVQKSWEEHKNIAAIAREFSISPPTVERYIGKTEKEISAMDHITAYKKRKTIFDDYMNIIYKMLRDNVKPEVIFSYVIKTGYAGNLKSLQNYIEVVAENNFRRRFWINWPYKFSYPNDVSVIKRNEILKYITVKNPDIKKDENVSKYIDIIKQKYEIVAVLENIYDDFYKTLMGNDTNRLDNFVYKHESSPVKAFIDGIKEDIAPVRNAISSHISSGFVEGNNNKFKLIKRILYGRADLPFLFKKSYLAFLFSLDDFSLQNFVRAISPF